MNVSDASSLVSNVIKISSMWLWWIRPRQPGRRRSELIWFGPSSLSMTHTKVLMCDVYLQTEAESLQFWLMNGEKLFIFPGKPGYSEMVDKSASSFLTSPSSVSYVLAPPNVSTHLINTNFILLLVPYVQFLSGVMIASTGCYLRIFGRWLLYCGEHWIYEIPGVMQCLVNGGLLVSK